MDQAVKIHQDVNLYATILKQGDRLSYSFSAERYGWLQLAKGEVILNQIPLTAGDGSSDRRRTRNYSDCHNRYRNITL